MNVDQKLIAFGIITALVVGLATVAYNVYNSTLKNESYAKCIAAYVEIVRDSNAKRNNVFALPSNMCYVN